MTLQLLYFFSNLVCEKYVKITVFTFETRVINTVDLKYNLLEIKKESSYYSNFLTSVTCVLFYYEKTYNCLVYRRTADVLFLYNVTEYIVKFHYSRIKSNGFGILM